MPDELYITLNGQDRSYPAGTTLWGLVQALKLEPERLAIEMNKVIVRRDSWMSTTIENRAMIEIVMFVGGG
jgi:thiamine biosynthesis protein ThiS